MSAATRQFQTLNNVVNNVNRGSAALNANMINYNTNASNAIQQNRRMGISFGNLLKLMAQFGIALAIVQAPFKLRDAFVDLIKVGGEWEFQLRQVNTILRLSDDHLAQFSNRMHNVTIETGATGDVLKATFNIAQQLQGLQFDPLREEFRGLSQEAQAVHDIFRAAQRAALATNADIELVTGGLSKVMSLLGFAPSQAESITDIFFKIQEVTDLTVQDISENVGDVIGFIDQIAAGDKTRAIKELTDALAIVGTMSQALPPDEAFTGFRNFIVSLTGRGSEQVQFRDELARLGVDFTLVNTKAKGLGATFQEVFKLLPQGQIVDKIIAQNQEYVDVVGEENARFEFSIQLLRKLFPEIRANRAVLASLTQQGAVFNETLADAHNNLGSTTQAVHQMSGTLNFAVNQLIRAGIKIKSSLSESFLSRIARGFSNIAFAIQDITDLPAFQKADFAGKISILLSELSKRFENWFRGEGKAKLAELARESGEAFGEIFAFFIGGGGSNIYAQAGISAAKNFMQGFVQGALGLGPGSNPIERFSGFLGSPIIRGLAGFAAAKTLGFGFKGGLLGGALGAATVGLPGGPEGMLQGLLSIGGGILAGRAIYGAGRGLFNKGAAAVTTANLRRSGTFANLVVAPTNVGGGPLRYNRKNIPINATTTAAGRVGGFASRTMFPSLLNRVATGGGLGMLGRLGGATGIGLMGLRALGLTNPIGIGLTAASIGVPLLINYLTRKKEPTPLTENTNTGSIQTQVNGGVHVNVNVYNSKDVPQVFDAINNALDAKSRVPYTPAMKSLLENNN